VHSQEAAPSNTRDLLLFTVRTPQPGSSAFSWFGYPHGRNQSLSYQKYSAIGTILAGRLSTLN
jgi:hypothetical protein